MLRSSLEAAMSGEAWSFGGLVFGSDRLLDDEGRPVSERRAPSDVKKGVPIELRLCPYPDERRGGWMNVSALAQITRHFEEVLADVARLHASMSGVETGWERMFTAVVDQLSAPARDLLEAREPGRRVPAKCAVARKLAAGYYGVLRRRLMAEACGERLPATPERFDAFVREQRALVGASEVCAGPPNMIAHATEVFMNGTNGTESPQDGAMPARTGLARVLAQQVQVGIAWQLFDLRAERELLVDDARLASLRPRNRFLAGEIERRVAAIEDGTAGAGSTRPRLPRALSSERASRLAAGMEASSRPNASPPETVRPVEELFALDAGAIELSAPGLAAKLAQSFTAYVGALRSFVGVQWELERELRALLGYPLAIPIRLHTAVLPKPRALRWYEAALGHSIRSELAPGTDLTLGNHLRTVSIAGAARGGP